MNSIVGIQLDLRENASATAPRVVEALQKIGQAGEAAGEQVQNAFDQLQLPRQFDQFASSIDKLYQTREGQARQLQTENVALRNQMLRKQMARTDAVESEQSKSFLSPADLRKARAVLNMPERTGQVLGGLGESGDILGMVGGTAGSLGELGLKSGSPLGMALGAVAIAIGGFAILTNTLSKQYEQFIPTLMDTTAAFGQLTDSVNENTKNFGTNLEIAAKSAMKFGYSLEQGLDIFGQLAKTGMSAEQAKYSGENIFSYARGTGTAPGDLVRSEGIATRYKAGNILGYAYGGLAASEMGNESGRYQEYLSALTDAFEEALDRGVVPNLEELSGTMNYFSQFGEVWKGALGAKTIGQMTGAMNNAANLQSETDVLMYRAAMGMTGGDSLKALMKLEGPMTTELFKAIGEQLKLTTGGNRNDMVFLLKNMFGTNFTKSSVLMEAILGGDWKKGAGIVAEAPKADSAEMQLIEALNNLRYAITGIGSFAMGIKLGIARETNVAVSGVADLFGATLSGRTKSFASIANLESLDKIIEAMGTGEEGLLLKGALQDKLITGALYSALENGSPEEVAAAKSAISILGKTKRGAMSVVARGLPGVVAAAGPETPWSLEPTELINSIPYLEELINRANANVPNAPDRASIKAVWSGLSDETIDKLVIALEANTRALLTDQNLVYADERGVHGKGK